MSERSFDVQPPSWWKTTWLRGRWRRPTSGSFARQVAVVAGGTALAQVITVAVSPVLTRIYSPADFGILSVYISILGLAVVAASLRYEVAIPLPARDRDAINVLALALSLVAVVAVLVTLVTALFADRLLGGGKYSSLRPYVWILPVGVLAAGTYQALSFWAIRKQEFRGLARTKISQSAGQATTQVCIGLLHGGTIGLLIGDVIGRAGGTGTLAALAWRGQRHLWQRVTISRMKRVAKRYRRFPLLSSGSALLNAATLQLPLLLIASLYGPQVAGLFALGQRVLAAPMNLLGNAVANVYYSSISELARSAPERLQRSFIGMSKRLAAIGVGPIMVAGLLGPRICQFAFGAQWREAGIFLQLLTPMLLLQFIASPLGGTLDVLERQDLHLIREIFRQAVAIGALLAAKMLDLDPWHAVLLFSAAGTMGNTFYIGSTWYALRDVSAQATANSAR